VGEKLATDPVTGLKGGYTDVLGTPGQALAGELEFVDQSIGRFVNELKAQTLFDSTGQSLRNKFDNPGADPRTPDSILKVNTGVIFSGGSKLAEHGGFNEDEVHTALLVAFPQLGHSYTLTNGLCLGQAYGVGGYPSGSDSGTGLPWAPATDGLRNITGQVGRDCVATIWVITSTISATAMWAPIQIGWWRFAIAPRAKCDEHIAGALIAARKSPQLRRRIM
jgi:hypothetical protein